MNDRQPIGVDFRSAARLSGRDPSAKGRAGAAADEVSRRYGAMIEAVQNDRSLSPEQKASAIRTLRDRQKGESRAVRRRVMDEGKITMQAVRRSERELAGWSRRHAKVLH